MRRALRRAALALVAAGAPGLAGQAVAQVPTETPPPMAMPPADTAREGRGRLEEMKVEMAWLADPVTFHCPLAARTVDGNLELRGPVSGEVQHEKALKLAKAHTHLPVVDVLEIRAESAPPEAGVDADAVRQGAVEVLNEAFAMAARGFEIRAENGGQVVVSGSVSSVEEKLAVSRKLRKVRGCTCVANYLQISPTMRDGRMVTQINAAGTLVVPGQVLCLDGTGQEPSPPRAAVVATQVVPPSRVAVVPPRKLPVTTAVPVTQPARPPQVQQIVYPPQAAPVPAPVAAPVPTAVMPIEMPEPVSPAPLPRVQAVTRTGPVIFLPPPPAPSLTPDPNLKTVKATAPMPDLPPLPPVPPAPSRPSALLPRDPATKIPAPAPVPEKEVDLLAAPTVPPSWSRDAVPPAPAPGTAKQPAKGPSNFATVRSDPPRHSTTDELLSLPAVPITDGAKKPAAAGIPPVPAPKPVVDNAVTKSSSPPSPTLAPWVVVTPAADPAPQTKPAPTTVSVQVPPAAPAVKPLPVPPPTNFKDTWVDAAPAPKPVSKPGHPLPPPGGWPAAHLSQPTPAPYVTSGLVTFPDEQPPGAKPAPEPAVRVQPAVAQPVVVQRSVVQPVAAPAVPPAVQPAALPALQPAALPVRQPPVTIITPPASGPVITVTPPTLVVTPNTKQLKQQVEKACGKLATQVEVTQTEKGMTVRIKCADSTVAQKVTEKVLVNVPAMSDSKVKFEVYAGP